MLSNAQRVEGLEAKGYNIVLPDHYRCALSLEVMTAPVMLASGKVYEKSQVEELYAQYKKNNRSMKPICPLTGISIRHPQRPGELLPYYDIPFLRNEITDFIASHERQAAQIDANPSIQAQQLDQPRSQSQAVDVLQQLDQLLEQSVPTVAQADYLALQQQHQDLQEKLKKAESSVERGKHQSKKLTTERDTLKKQNQEFKAEIVSLQEANDALTKELEKAKQDEHAKANSSWFPSQFQLSSLFNAFDSLSLSQAKSVEKTTVPSDVPKPGVKRRRK